MGNSATYVQGAGTTSGGAPVIAEASNVDYTGGGASVVHERGYYGHLSGNIAHGQTFVAEGCVGAAPSIVFVAKAFENAGTIDFTSSKYNGSDCGGNDRTQFKIESGALTNTGTINVEPGIGGERDIEGSVTNQGTVNVAATTNDNTGGTTFTNEGTVNLTNSSRFNFGGSTTFTSGAGGLIDAVGSASVTLGGSSTFDQGAGSAIGNAPIIAEASTINYTGTGASVIHARSYYSHIAGDLAHDQTLVLEGCVGGGSPAVAIVSKTVENAGTIDLTSSKYAGNDCGGGDRADLKVEPGAKLTNTGNLNVEPGTGGERIVEGALENERFLTLSDAVKLTNSGTFTQGSDGTLIVPVASSSSYGQMAVSGVASLGGTLEIAPAGGFKGELGQKLTVITDSSHENAFIHEANAVITSNLWYKPVYSPTTAFGLEVAEGTPPEKPPVNEAKPTVSGTAKQGDTLVAQPGAWKGEAFAYSYQWQRCTEAGTECKPVPGAYFRDYLLTGADAGHRLTVAVTAYNAAGGSAGAESAPTAIVSALPLHAAAGETVEGTEGSPVTLDGSGSTPSAEITTYRWKFGDGSEEAGAADGIVHHTYATAGSYTAQLTVSGKGEESSATVKVVVHAKPKPAEAPW